MMTVHELIGARIREARRASGIQQEELAERVGLTRTSISNYERGTQNLTVESLYAICAALKIEPYTLLPSLEEVGKIALNEPVYFWERLAEYECLPINK